MMTAQLSNPIPLAFLSFLIFGHGLIPLPILANEPLISGVEAVEPLETPTGNSQDIGTLEINSSQSWQWGSNGNNQTNRNNIEYDITPETLDNPLETDPQKEEQEWQDLHRGDPRNTGGRFPITDF